MQPVIAILIAGIVLAALVVFGVLVRSYIHQKRIARRYNIEYVFKAFSISN